MRERRPRSDTSLEPAPRVDRAAMGAAPIDPIEPVARIAPLLDLPLCNVTATREDPRDPWRGMRLAMAARGGAGEMNVGVTSPSGRRAWKSHLRLESAYLSSALELGPGEPGAHAVELSVDGWLGQEALRGQLVIDPNACDVNDFGDRVARTRLPARSYSIALTRLRAEDPAHEGRRLYAITGKGLPEGLTLVLHPWGDRVCLKLADAMVPLSAREIRHP
ncbi:MAG: hypothetical protein R3B70_16885 [Polyangiaceae bacterium]